MHIHANSVRLPLPYYPGVSRDGEAPKCAIQAFFLPIHALLRVEMNIWYVETSFLSLNWIYFSNLCVQARQIDWTCTEGIQKAPTSQPLPMIPQPSLLSAKGDECTLAGGVAVIGVYVHAKRALRVENFPCATSISPLPNRALIDQLRFHRFQSVWIGEEYVEAIYPDNDDDLVLRLIYFIFDRARVSQLVETHGFFVWSCFALHQNVA